MESLQELAAERGESVSSIVRRAIANERYVQQTFGENARLVDLAPNERLISRNDELPRELTTFQLDEVGVSADQPGKTLELGLLDPAGNSLTSRQPAVKPLITSVSAVSLDLKRRLAEDPELLRTVGWKKFEDIIAELLHDQGYEVTQVPNGKDTGVDIFAAQDGRLGKFLYLVQCKNYAEHRSVGLPVVDRLYGRVRFEHANAGMIATTSSRFTSRAQAFADTVPYEMSLKAFGDLWEWVQDWR